MKSFNSDRYIRDEVIKLRDKFYINIAIETGTQYGHTTKELSYIFDHVYSVEVDYDTFKQAECNLNGINNIILVHSDSIEFLNILPKHEEPVLFYLDAHGNGITPLINEINIVCSISKSPIIVIHDFKVPGNIFGFDTYNGQEYTYEWIEPTLKEHYPCDYDFHYNNKAEGSLRGVIYIYPKV